MNNKKILLLTRNFKNLPNNKKYFGFIPFNTNIEHANNIEAVNYDMPSRKEILWQYDFCNNLFHKILKQLSEKLNFFHKINLSTKEWDIILGYWLKNYIYLGYKIYVQLGMAVKKYDIEKIYLTEFNDYDFTVSDTFEFATIESANIDWYFSFCSKMYDYFKFGNKNSEKFPNKLANDKINSLNYKENNKIFIKTLKSIGKFLRFNNDAFIHETYLPLKEEKKLQLYFNRFPNFYNSIKIDDEKYDHKARKSISFTPDGSDKTIENFIKENIKIFLPKSFLENFEKITKIAKSKNFPQNPKFIFTSMLHNFDEAFKLYTAFQVIKKTPLYIGQHGHNYFTRIHNNNNFNSELNYSDKFLSWGHKDNKKINSLFNFKTLNKKPEFDKKGDLVIVFDAINNTADNLYYTPSTIMEDILNIKRLIKNLNSSIQKRTILRLNCGFFSEIYGLKYSELLKDLNISIDKGDTKIKKLYKQSQMFLFTYDSTGFLENYIYDIPSIIFCNKNYLNSINEKFYPRYKDLQKNQIMFTDEKNLAKHINSIWDETDKWWQSEKTKSSLENFNKDLNNKPYIGCLDDLKSKLFFKKTNE